MFHFLKLLFIEKRFYKASFIVLGVYFIGFFFSPFVSVGHSLLLLLIFIFIGDIYYIFHSKINLEAIRTVSDRLSNGDSNKVEIEIKNITQKELFVTIYDELPHQFQRRDIVFKLSLKGNAINNVKYYLVPKQRGVYDFGDINVFVKSKLGFISKKEVIIQHKEVKVYPSYLQLKKFEFYAIHNHLQEYGIKKVQKVGHNLEFEQIKDYVQGDDYRTFNWKAIARKGSLMVNVYQDEKSQQIYSIVDKGRVMKMPFEGMTLLDYAINASLVMSSIAIAKQDKAGIASFDTDFGTFLPASRQSNQMQNILDLLYKQTTNFGESDYGTLYSSLRKRLNQRSLIILYTNFENQLGMERQLPYLRQIAKQHVLVCVFFQNTEVATFLNEKTKSTEHLYQKIIAEKFDFERRIIVKKLNQFGIYTVLSSPKDLTVNVINKYLQLKDRRVI
ncbi:MAG: DUF58 domain-containing protein [Bacteroidota bacterium]